MGKTISKTWNHKENESQIYEEWEASEYFKPEVNQKVTSTDSVHRKDTEGISLQPTTYKLQTNKKPFVIAIPPPNVTGELHIGHALFATLQDIMIRYHRALGEPSLWIPGTDHAGIATQTVVDKMLKKQGINRFEIGREKFLDHVWEWKEKYGGKINKQLRAVGASCDWSRERFTLDPGMSKAVNEAFVRLYDSGLIYRGEYLVNWCPKCGTAIADDEVEHLEQKAKLYYFKYDKNFPISIATTRPETKLGDVAVAVNPNDARYKEYVGKTYHISLDGVTRQIQIIASRSIDAKFGTGAVGVTPSHSAVDWRLAEEHNLPKIKVLNEQGRMSDEAGEKYRGLKTGEARDKLVEYLKSSGLMEKVEEVENSLSVCYRCNAAIEPIPSLQWFVKMKALSKAAKESVESGEIKIIPKRFEKVYFHWLDNIRDWCISRQLWWGHRIPVWYKRDAISKSHSSLSLRAHPSESKTEFLNPKQIPNLNGQNSNKLPPNKPKPSSIYVGVLPPEGEGWVQDEDVLDTWFSSGLWPFSTLGWPENKPKAKTQNPKITDYEYFYPTTVMETGYDILFFWVARMIMMGKELTGKNPFQTVYLHGLVRDEKNRKMSKSLGNGIDPIEVIEKYGADALRMALVVGATPGQDIPVGENKIKGYRNFSNKIWNACRFVALRVSDGDLQGGMQGEYKIQNTEYNQELLTDADKEVLKVHKVIKSKVKKYLDEFKFSLAGETLYDYFWHDFCDVYIEKAKEQLKPSLTNYESSESTNNSENENRIGKLDQLDPPAGEAGIRNSNVSENTKKILIKTLSETLIMLHPFVPFVTEAVWQELREICPSFEKSIMLARWPEE